MKLILFAFITVAFLGCKKESDQRHCWQMVDALGNDLNEICNKTEQELLDCTDCGIYNGGQAGEPLRDMVDSCNYFSTDDPVYCWDIGNNQHVSNASEKLMHCFAPGAVKVACGSWERWYTRKKSTYVPTGQITYGFITYRDYTNKDTLALFNGTAQIVLVNTADSLIILQRSRDGSSFY